MSIMLKKNINELFGHHLAYKYQYPKTGRMNAGPLHQLHQAIISFTSHYPT